MITSKEKAAVKLSPTHKDFYQIWNELLETAGKLSERWDPSSSTNESDPGIVLLKVLAAVSDKLNYNIDKNILEAFMPSASQRESMAKLCEMMGYNMKYYRAATTRVSITYKGEAFNEKAELYQIPIDIFTNVKSGDGAINYVITEPASITRTRLGVEVSAIAGELVTCTTNDANNLIYLDSLDDNYRYYLPETQIAENGLFILNAITNSEGQYAGEIKAVENFWERVENLNTVPLGSKVFKFGFDSARAIPYVQFPEDINTIIGDGLVINYIRSRGVSENISARTLSKLEKPFSWSASSSGENLLSTLSVDDFRVTNYSAAVNGNNPETLEQAYNNFKRVVGTFDTLVTCRDYMNKIYSLTEQDLDIYSNSTAPVVSNINVADVRTDINNAVTVCTFNEKGINYIETVKQLSYSVIKYTQVKKYTDDQGKEHSESNDYYYEVPSKYISKATVIDPGSDESREADITNTALDPNDAQMVLKHSTGAPEVPKNTEITVLSGFTHKLDTMDYSELKVYPQVPRIKVDTAEDFKKTFEVDPRLVDTLFNSSSQLLENCKTLTYKISGPQVGDITSINLKIKLSANIVTTRKVTSAEETEIRKNVQTALFNRFNAREVDFSAEILYEDVLKCIEEADARIKVVALNDFEWTPYVQVQEELTQPGEVKTGSDFKALTAEAGRDYLKELVARNVVAGRVSLYEYDLDFAADFTETKWGEVYPAKWNAGAEITSVFPQITLEVAIAPSDPAADPYTDAGRPGVFIPTTIPENTYIYFSAPNYRDGTIYPAYVNYYWDWGNDEWNEDKDNYRTIPANTDHLIANDEKLYINYTTVTKDSNGNEIKNVINKKFTAEHNMIIRPNFELMASIKVATQYSPNNPHWSKTADFDDTWPIDGMLTLGPDEQIAERKPVQVEFKSDSITNYYLESLHDITVGSGAASYVLGDSEYFIYTDMYKKDWAYVGSGTRLVFTQLTRQEGSDTLTPDPNATITLKRGERELPLEQLTQYGVTDLDIPWTRLVLNSKQTLIAQEQQIIVLGEGDCLKQLTMPQKGDTNPPSIWKLNYSAQPVGKATWSKKGETTEHELPVIPQGTNWDVCSRFVLNCTPTRGQKLPKGAKIVCGYNLADGSPNEKPGTISGGDNVIIKANRLILGIMDETPVQNTVDGERLEPLKIKVSQADPTISGNIENVLVPFTTNWYQVDLKQLQKLTDRTIKLYLNFPYGIEEPVLNMYAPNLSNDVQYRVKAAGKPDPAFSIFPANQLIRLGKETLMPTSTAADAASNTIPGGWIEITCGEEDTAAQGTLLISNLSFIKGLNPVLTPIPSSELASLRTLCDELAGEYTFYDTCPINNQVAIDFAGEDNINSYTTWLDKNNINNNFVICQLDSNFEGIKLTKSSKIN